MLVSCDFFPKSGNGRAGSFLCGRPEMRSIEPMRLCGLVPSNVIQLVCGLMFVSSGIRLMDLSALCCKAILTIFTITLLVSACTVHRPLGQNCESRCEKISVAMLKASCYNLPPSPYRKHEYPSEARIPTSSPGRQRCECNSTVHCSPTSWTDLRIPM
jgi:hypothetical protein